MTATEKKAYLKIKGMMENAGTYDPMYELVIEHTAHLLVMVEEAKKKVKPSTYIQTYKTGAKAISPEMGCYRNLMKDFLDHCGALGLTWKAQQSKKSTVKAEAKRRTSKLMALRQKSKAK